MTEKLQRARTLGELIRGVVLTVVGVRLVLEATNQLRATAEVIDLPPQAPPADDAPPAGEAPTPA